ncbi:putative double-strand break repair protein AddB [Candidatus Megaera venefica]|uniref:Double-strand break repair protein AddB n=1 Tax=Candidatus Megaera venefica TaxID=2055910 RepID=A0ABU5NAM5_9RICK|nr:PD-(D/E)XK nuclease family protein [Candidatus Megaera venefica]MEA0970211.1 putative double-strand break repair protein AddB [Candidatus Megaera venefica]
MTAFQSSSKFTFLENVAQIAINNSANDFTKLKILLPTGLACSELQKILVTKLGTCILPKIIPISELVAESEEIFKIPSEQIGSISRLEEKITLASTISEYKTLGYNLVQSLRLSPSLANLFFELEANDIKLEEIKQLPILDQPEHWHKIHDFLSFAFGNWQIKIQSMKKMTRASYQKLMFDSEIQRLSKDKSEILILAGIVSNNLMTSEFIKTALRLDNCLFIAQPEFDLNTLTNNRLFSKLATKEQMLGAHGAQDQSVLNVREDLSTVATKQMPLVVELKYVEFENIAHEAEYIALRCASELSQTPTSRIALITHNQYSKEQYQLFLEKYSLGYKDQFGDNIFNQHSISLILIVAELLCSDFDLKRFFTFLAHPMINSIHSQKLKNIIRKNNKFASNLETILSILEIHGGQELLKYFRTITNALAFRTRSNQFNLVFKNVIKVVEKLVPTIWQNSQGTISLISEIVRLKHTLEINNIGDFPEILRQIIDGGRLFPPNHEQQIIICQPSSSGFINYDLTIITDLNEGNYPNIAQNNPWLSKKMQIMLGLDKRQINFDKALYDFYMNIQNRQVLITRAKKQGTNKLTLPSPFILNLKHILGKDLETIVAKPVFDQYEPILPEISAKSESFPDTLYATDIETLIRSPYNFYAKKILKLRKIDEIDERPNLAEFGNFFHLVVEQYTKHYNSQNVNKSLQVISIAESILADSTIPDYSKKLWKIKITALADELIKFDEDRRESAIKIYSEIEGHTTLNIKGKNITLKAIADRVELDQDGTLAIIDFKTGSVPTKKDVLSGLSPQLLIEAIIACEGGFPLGSELSFKNGVVIIYVKIGSSSPYISLTEITLSLNEIAKHKAGLSNLLGHYIDTLEFPAKPNLMKYDDYSHLARRN